MKGIVLEFLMWFPYIFLVAAHFKFINNSKWQYTIDLVDGIVRLFVCLTLLIKFNIFRKSPLTQFDKMIGFNAGLLLLSSTILNSYKVQIINYITPKVK